MIRLNRLHEINFHWPAASSPSSCLRRPSGGTVGAWRAGCRAPLFPCCTFAQLPGAEGSSVSACPCPPGPEQPSVHTQRRQETSLRDSNQDTCISDFKRREGSGSVRYPVFMSALVRCDAFTVQSVDFTHHCFVLLLHRERCVLQISSLLLRVQQYLLPEKQTPFTPERIMQQSRTPNEFGDTVTFPNVHPL